MIKKDIKKGAKKPASKVKEPKIKNNRVEAPKVETSEENIPTEQVETQIQEVENAVQDTARKGLDPNHTTDLLKLSAKYFHDTPDAAKRYGLSQKTVDTMDRCTAVGVIALYAQEVTLSETPWARTMKPVVLENLVEAGKELGIVINVKALPKPDKEGNITVTGDNIKVSKETKEQLKEEKKILEEGPIMDVDKINDEETLRKSLLFFFTERKDYLSNIFKAIGLYRAYKEKSEKEYGKNTTRIQMLHEIIGLIKEAPIVMNGIGSFLYSITSVSKSPVSAFCHLRNTVTDRKTGECSIEDRFIADVVREIVLWKIAINIADAEKSIVAVNKNIKELSKNKEQNEAAIKEQEERLTVLNANIEKFKNTAQYVTNPDFEVVETFIQKKNENDVTYTRMYKTLVESIYRNVDIHDFKLDGVNKNLKIHAGIITNLFRDPLAQMPQYKASELTELEKVEEATEGDGQQETEESKN